MRTLANGSELTTRLPTGKAIFWCTVYLTTPAAERFENGPEVLRCENGPEVPRCENGLGSAWLSVGQ